jgi:hypothetical protein
MVSKSLPTALIQIAMQLIPGELEMANVMRGTIPSLVITMEQIAVHMAIPMI